MSCSRILIALAMIAALLIVATPAAQAGHTYFGDTHPVLNHINRCLGIGWSDGYHAYGSRDCWSRNQPQYSYLPPQPTMMWAVPSAPVIVHGPSPDSQPLPTPARPLSR